MLQFLFLFLRTLAVKSLMFLKVEYNVLLCTCILSSRSPLLLLTINIKFFHIPLFIAPPRLVKGWVQQLKAFFFSYVHCLCRKMVLCGYFYLYLIGYHFLNRGLWRLKTIGLGVSQRKIYVSYITRPGVMLSCVDDHLDPLLRWEPLSLILYQATLSLHPAVSPILYQATLSLHPAVSPILYQATLSLHPAVSLNHSRYNWHKAIPVYLFSSHSRKSGVLFTVLFMIDYTKRRDQDFNKAFYQQYN